MSTRTQVGDVIVAADGNEYTVYTTAWADEAPESVVIDGRSVAMYFDPGNSTDRNAILALVARLADALTFHDKAVEDIHGSLQVGSSAHRVRIAYPSDTQCTHRLGEHQCSRVEHADGHHVTVDDSGDVVAVEHPDPLIRQRVKLVDIPPPGTGGKSATHHCPACGSRYWMLPGTEPDPCVGYYSYALRSDLRHLDAQPVAGPGPGPKAAVASPDA